MPLIVETGQGIPNADSYVSLEDGRALAAKYGLELPEDDTAAEAIFVMVRCTSAFLSLRCADVVYLQTRR